MQDYPNILVCVVKDVMKPKRSTVSRTSVFPVKLLETESGTVWEEKMNWKVSELI